MAAFRVRRLSPPGRGGWCRCAPALGTRRARVLTPRGGARLERFERAHATHQEYHRRADELGGPKIGQSASEYPVDQIRAGKVFIGCEGSEPAMEYAVKVVGSEPFIYSSDFPHEVTAEMCKEEIQEVVESDALTAADKEAILHTNSVRLYNLSQPSA